ncbi:hypothetical protein GALL_520750 [mine drainage metagenome]|uniref:Uncharacterized protein n=1 Tax=mine drainage metagenome TaxID=410659 RepID=A0A1J5P592_9ZZZZ
MLNPLRGARQQAQQTGFGFVAQGQYARMIQPALQTLAKFIAQPGQQISHAGASFGCLGASATRALALGTAQQFVKFLCCQFAMDVELLEQLPGRVKAHGCRNPGQISILRWQHMGLLVVQILDAVLYPA